jgi:SAM-dependent methyltransferase
MPTSPTSAVAINRLTHSSITWRSRDYLHYSSFFRVLRSAIADFATGDLLDIGCGNKPFEPLFENRISRYFGVDMAQSHLNKVDLICDATRIPLPDAHVDTVFCTQTIEHVFDHGKMLAEAFRLLKPGGHLILSGPFYWPLHEEPFDFFRFTRYGFEQLVQQHGFQLIRIQENGGLWALAGQSLIHALVNSKIGLIRFLFGRCRFYIVFNLLFGWMDRIDMNSSATINYVLIAKKPC